MKLIEKSILLGFILTVLLSITCFSGRCDSIKPKVLRLHVMANSNSKEDQLLKLKVRDKILNYAQENFCSVNSKTEAEQEALKDIDKIKKIAQEEIHNNGYSYNVNAELTNMYFNTRHYDNITLPAGHYDALRITIGSGQGKNWWCVIFPPMCLPAAEGSKELDSVLSQDEMDIVKGADKYEMKFKFIEVFETVKERMST